MPGKLKRERAVLSTLLNLALLALSLGGTLFARSDLVNAASPNEAFRPHTVQVKPVIHKLPKNLRVKARASVKPVRFSCQRNDDPQPMLCYGPYQIREAYGVTSLLEKKISGQGSTIAIVDAYGSPTIQQDLRAFNEAWGLPDATLNIVAPFGGQQTDSTWAPEVSVDVEWAHVMAPDATINLVVAKSSNDVDLYYAIKYAVEHDLGDVISLSFGESEFCIDPKLRRAQHRVFEQAAQKGITVVAAAGDFGPAQYSCDNTSLQQAVSLPAADPLVTAVGGTTLNADAATGKYISETTWNESEELNKATGGGYSTTFARPTYQDGVTGNTPGRAVPDISLNASINGGVLVYQSSTTATQPSITVIGGTSVGAPELAGIIADGVQMAHHRLGTLNPRLYKLGQSKDYEQVMNDITSGNNTLPVARIPGYAARKGWDAVTGWGSPKQAETFLQAMIGPPDTTGPVPNQPTAQRCISPGVTHKPCKHRYEK